jgi:hypothetical protein
LYHTGARVAGPFSPTPFCHAKSIAPGDNLPIILSVIGVAFITISSWLGGELVYVRGVAVKQPPDQSV